MFGLTVIAFFFMTKRLFLKSLGEKNSNILALIASFFLSVMPPLLPRTIAGIPEKESTGFLFMFLAFYFFICAWEGNKDYKKYLYALLAGLSTGIMALIWGGYQYIFVTISLSLCISFILNKIDKEKIKIIVIWLVVSFALMNIFSSRYNVKGLLSSSVILFSILPVLFYFVNNYLMENRKIEKYYDKHLNHIPKPLIAIVLTLIIGILLSSLVFGPSYTVTKFGDLKKFLVNPITDRFGVTVAENRQPYFNEWESSFGPHIKEIAISFWLMIIGSIFLVFILPKELKIKERIITAALYFVLILGIIFSRYKPDSILNGENFISRLVYLGGLILFVIVFGFYYFKYYKSDEIAKLKSTDFGLIMTIAFFIFGIISARGSVRTIMVLVPPASILISFLIVISIVYLRKTKDETLKAVLYLVIGLVLISSIFSGYVFYKSINAEARSYVPSIYTQQWQKAMFWVRESTPKTAVFGHWWDYGYWLQSIGERATVLDGGNAMRFWNHYMGRFALTGSSNEEALEFLYSHDTTHFLIDSTDIGKYSAFSSIGSDINYDRASYIPTIYRDVNQVQEKKNSTIFVYSGGIGLDEDINYNDNGTKIFLPSGQAGLGAILIEKNLNGTIIEQPKGVFVYLGKQYTLPLRYAYFNNKFKDFGTGVESGIYIYPRFIPTSQGSLQVDLDGALLYLSKRTVKSQLARLYLYKEDNKYFKLVHSEDDLIVAQIKEQNPSFKDYDIVDYQGLRGPIRIWEISYPKDIKLIKEYLSTTVPYNKTYAMP